MISVVVAESIASNIQTNEQRSLSQQLNGLATQIVNSPSSYSSLLANTFSIPDACTSGATTAATGTSVQSCITLAGRTWQVSWTVTPGSDPLSTSSLAAASLTLGGSVTLSPGDVVSVSRVVAAPSYAFSSGDGVVRVQVADPGSLLTGPVYLLSMANPSSVIASAQPSNGVAVLRGAASSCTIANPCVLGISSGNNYAVNGNAAMTASQVTGLSAQIVMTPGQATFATLQIRGVGKMVLNLTATNTSTGQTGLNPVAGSVCLFANFDDGTGQQSVPVCNFDRSESITLYDYAPDPSRPSVRVPFPTGVPITLSTDDQNTYGCDTVTNPNGTTPVGMLGWVSTGGGWVQRAECTSWTWGDPTSVTANGTTQSWGAATGVYPSVTLSAGSTLTGSVNWSGPGNATNVFVLDKAAGTVRMVSQSGVTTTFYSGLSSPQGMAEDQQGNLYIANTGAGNIIKLSGSGVASTITGFSGPQDVAISPDGLVLYVLDKSGSTVSLKEVYTSNNSVVGYPLQNTLSSTAVGIAVDAQGDVYIADTGNNRIIAIPSTAGMSSTVACSSECVLVPSGSLSAPTGLVVEPSGYLDVLDSGSTGNNPNSLMQVDPSTMNSDWLLTTGLSSPQRVAVDINGNLYITQNGSGANKVLVWNSYNYALSTLAGSGTASEVNGTGSGASFNNPVGVATVGGWALSQPAIGFGNVGVWSMPREARSCSALTDGSCATNSGGAYGATENTTCTTAFQLCYEAQVSYLTGPQVGGMNAVAVSGSTGVTMSFALNVADYVGATTTVKVSALPGSGTLKMGTSNSQTGATFATNGSAVTSGEQVASLPSGGGLVNMQWTEGASQITQTWFTVTLSNGIATKSYDVALYRTAGGWLVNGYSAIVAQGGSGTLSALVTLANGQAASTASATFSCTSCTGITFSPATVSSETAGVASTTVNVAAGTQAGTYPVTVNVGGRTGTAYVKVTAVLASLSVVVTSSTTQGSSVVATVTAKDANGQVMSGVATNFSISNGFVQATGVYASTGGCVTGSLGTCSVNVTVEAGAAAGTYHVGASSNGVSTSSNMTVTAAPFTLVATPGSVVQGSSSTTTIYDYDGTGAPLAGRTLSYSSSKSGLSVTSAGASNSSGLAVANITATSAVAPGNYKVTASDGAASVTFTVTVAGVPASVGAANVTVTRGGFNTTIVTVLDANGNGVPGQLVTISTPISGITVVQHATTGPAGTAIVTVYVSSSVSVGTKTNAVLLQVGTKSAYISVTVQ